jgi:hypothetical protein
MKTALNLILAAFLLGIAIGCQETSKEAGNKNDAAPEFKGEVAKTYEESKEWWPEKKRPPKDAPNVIIFLLDDVGFAQIGSFWKID